jgi:hypothetical protein
MGNKFSIAKTTKRSPLKALPLHTAGQSIDEEIHRIQTVEIGSYVAVSACMVFLACFEWYKWLTSAPPSPVTFSIGSAILVSYCVYKIIKFRQEVKTLRLARDGEKAVGEYLDSFREHGYRVLHDLVVGDFNIDHVIIGKTGIYTIETKTISKYKRGAQKIYYDGNEISINGIKPDRNPIIQAKSQAGWIRDFVKEMLNKKVQVKPVIVFPGWFIEGTTKADVWVLEPKGFKGFLSHRKQILDENDIAIIASTLSRYLRTCEEFSRKHE